MLGIINFPMGYEDMYSIFLTSMILTAFLAIILFIILLLIGIPTAIASKYYYNLYYKLDTIFTIIGKVSLALFITSIIQGLITLYAYVMKS